jgi:hypothetical protein
VAKEWQKRQPKRPTAAAAQPAPAAATSEAAPTGEASPTGEAAPTGATAPAEGQPPADPNAAAAGDTAAAPPADAAAQPPATDAPATAPADPNATADLGAAADPNATADATAATGETPPVGPTGPGFVIEMEGHHFHNDDWNQGAVFVRNTLIANLENKVIQLPVYDAQGRPVMATFSMKELGIDFPVITYDGKLESLEIDESGQILSQSDGYGGAAAPVLGAKPPITVKQYNFRVQFCWKPTPASKRLEARQPKPPAADASSGVALAPPPATSADSATVVEPAPAAPAAPDGAASIPAVSTPAVSTPAVSTPAAPVAAPSTEVAARKEEEAIP